MNKPRHLYLFLDESGNLDFSPNGTKYFFLSCIVKERPFNAYKELNELKYDLVESGLNLEYFHAAEDRQPVRDKVFDVIGRNLDGISVEAIIVEKKKVDPNHRKDDRFYPDMLGRLVWDILGRRDLSLYGEIVLLTDRIPTSRKRESIEKAVGLSLSKTLPESVRYRVLHHDSKSNFDLQIAYYCCWAIHKKWHNNDLRSYNLIRSAIGVELLVFEGEEHEYY